MAKNKFESVRSIVEGLHILSKNLWWTWRPEAQYIFRELSPRWWERTSHNAAALMTDISVQELTARLGDADFSRRVVTVLNAFDEYMNATKTWGTDPSRKLKGPVAYFSAEFGLHESVRIYSGGLGILAGDHTKSTSDLGIPFIGISLYYREGYFEQRISADGWQQELYIPVDPSRQPSELVTDAKGNPITCEVRIGFSTVKFFARRVPVGRSTILLLDTNLPENEERFRDITAHVYGGDASTRIAQEILLGVGGVRMLRAIGVKPSVYHMNEGHSAFLPLELLREEIAKGVERRMASVNCTDR
jgi:starch phosphorylase